MVRKKEKTLLKEMKKRYEKLAKKYKLPKFDEINKEFEIEKAFEEETSFLLRHVKKIMLEKLIGYLTFYDSLLVTQRPSFMFISKNIGTEEKEKITKMARELTKIVAEDLLINEVEASEVKDSEMIKKIWKKWKEIKPKMLDIGKKLTKEFNKKDQLNYLG